MPRPEYDFMNMPLARQGEMRNQRDNIAIRKWEVREEYNRQAVIILELMCYGIGPRMAMDRLMDYMNGVPGAEDYKRLYEELLALSQQTIVGMKSEIINLKLENERLKAAATTGEVMPQRRLLTEAEVKPTQGVTLAPVVFNHTDPNTVQRFIPIPNDQQGPDEMMRMIGRSEETDYDLEDLI